MPHYSFFLLLQFLKTEENAVISNIIRGVKGSICATHFTVSDIRYEQNRHSFLNFNFVSHSSLKYILKRKKKFSLLKLFACEQNTTKLKKKCLGWVLFYEDFSEFKIIKKAPTSKKISPQNKL